MSSSKDFSIFKLSIKTELYYLSKWTPAKAAKLI